MNGTADILIIGAGINGLMMADELCRQGERVVIFDKGRAGQESSWAGGGILSPLYAWQYPDAVNALAVPGPVFYKALASRLLAETGIDIECITSGLLIAGHDDVELARQWSGRFQVAMEVHESSPESELNCSGPVMVFPGVSQVRNPLLVKALKASLLDRGVQFVENNAVTDFRIQGDRVVGVKTATEAWQGREIVISSGAWSGMLLERLDMHLPIRPVRGQMLMFQAPAGLLRHICLKSTHYLIPRRDGNILAGSTLEHTGFSKTCTRDAYQTLRTFALAWLPALARASEVAQWAGLRPATPHGVPIIGPCPRYRGLWVNAGQFRNGLVMAPASAALAVDLILGRRSNYEPAPYRWMETKP